MSFVVYTASGIEHREDILLPIPLVPDDSDDPDVLEPDPNDDPDPRDDTTGAADLDLYDDLDLIFFSKEAVSKLEDVMSISLNRVMFRMVVTQDCKP
ncbi:hypothetical protein ACJMK2_040428 [Sinanodonta woodiana]|uniref:Uncharacterized protein n=1 Tax=Sinanodonta woodiana TaxID=1069815 RepID=A0ABD3WER2_SINWO